MVQAAIDGLIAQTRSIERAVAALEPRGRSSSRGSDSLDNPDAVFQTRSSRQAHDGRRGGEPAPFVWRSLMLRPAPDPRPAPCRRSIRRRPGSGELRSHRPAPGRRGPVQARLSPRRRPTSPRPRPSRQCPAARRRSTPRRQPRRLLAPLRDILSFEQAARLQGRQRLVPQALGLGAILDAGLGRPRARSTTPAPARAATSRTGGDIPPSRWPDGDGTSMFLRLSVPAEQRSRAAWRSRSAGTRRSRADLRRPAPGLRGPGASPEGRDADHVRGPAGDAPRGTVVALRRPTLRRRRPRLWAAASGRMLSPRVAPPMIGLGLLEAIHEADILAHADPDDARRRRHLGPAEPRAGSWSTAARCSGGFGWKAGRRRFASRRPARSPATSASRTPLLPGAAGECTEAEAVCLRRRPAAERPAGVEAARPGARPRHLLHAQPRRAGAPPGRRSRGASTASRCSTSRLRRLPHAEVRDTGDAPSSRELSFQLIWPYTDLLLHDMGEGLADHRPRGPGQRPANGGTAPLWGIGLTETVSGHTCSSTTAGRGTCSRRSSGTAARPRPPSSASSG